MTKLKTFDHETTGVDVSTCEVVQSALVEATLDGARVDWSGVREFTQLFYAANIPAAATAVHGISAEDVSRCHPFPRSVGKFVAALTADDTISVSYNGTGFDIPLTARIAAEAGLGTREAIEQRLRARHIDVMRLWMRLKQDDIEPPWQDVVLSVMADADPQGIEDSPQLTASMFGATLTAAHGFFVGRGFAGAHDACVDCRATLAVLDAMFAGGLDIETAIEWSNQPLPGDVDFAGKFKWDEGGRAVISFGKHKGAPLNEAPASYLRWMASADFPEDTKRIVRSAMAGRYPKKKD